MEAALQLRIQRYGWDKAAPHYDAHWARQLKPAQQRLLEMAALQPGERVLDAASGTGLVAFPAAAAVGHGGAVVATDISAHMVQALRDEAAARGFDQLTTRRVHLEESHGEAGAFDAALCGFGLMYTPDPIAAFREMYRVLRPGGRAVVAVWGARAACGWAEIFPIVDRRVRSEVCPMFFRLGTGDTLQREMSIAGFAAIEVCRFASTLDYADAADALGATFIGGPVAMAYSRFDEDARASAHREYLQSIARFARPDGGFAIPGEFVVARGVRLGAAGVDPAA